VPSFAATAPDLAQAGPLVQVSVGVPQNVRDALTAAGQPVPAPVTMQFLIDTGASLTVIRTGTCAGLGLHPVGIVNIHTPTDHDVPAEQFSVSLGFPNNVVASPWVVTEAGLPGQNIDGLLGRDLLSRGVLVYLGYAGAWSVSF
jgi:hypothetical protein